MLQTKLLSQNFPFKFSSKCLIMLCGVLDYTIM